MRQTIAAAAVLLLVGGSAHGQEPSFAPVVDSLIKTVIVPAHTEFTAAADAQAGRMAELCKTPSEATLAAARTGFIDLVAKFAKVEPYRFGPARVENRIERLYFWPDRRGRGLRQVQGLLAKEDPSATDVATLTGKSVAVQGLPAFEFILFGTGSDALAGTEAPYRCNYGAAVAEAISAVAQAMEGEWRGSFAEVMRTAGSDNQAYRSDREALQDILQGAAEQLEFVKGFKLEAAVRGSPDEARPKRAPFWRANATLPAIIANLEATQSLLTEDLAGLLGEDEGLVNSADFELNQAIRALSSLTEGDRTFADLVADPDAHKRLSYAQLPVGAAHALFAQRIPGRLGMVAGFNALDGD
ncbi:MAG: imelysin family protein [Pseudomonadota bacterium]